ncbi:hypothetical protein Q3P06_23685 [Ralstonia pseudosolanacearum]|uniref:hypothetical protein n=1 Tax=Ralstonia pseudosolanacearum TaxID=1310165 RepID=UPI00048D5356|nr:hypothetical protein [Ralstonia pseudosolanacearum]MDO3514897.1 hypothetical protein [Ralstonia pseudosolanacearum]MDO3525215.1 hypothetical protein [Ralstonia pseudosolanacearum]MDO3549860.1 hypothetical protein [Ralstonia pseudosolanacearum]MDO3558744.1 hypothetical protein [Ralstonia pseudosolanacearum]MDO3563661.1 hypothetical protein [Ralstonia pseudosolanacearum]
MLDFNHRNPRPKTRSAIDPRRTRRAARPRPLVTIRAVERLLLRHVPAPVTGLLPEQRLIVAVLCQAIADARYADRKHLQEDAERFLRSDDLAQVAGLIDLNPAFVREVAVKTGYLLAAPDELQDRSVHARLQ